MNTIGQDFAIFLNKNNIRKDATGLKVLLSDFQVSFKENKWQYKYSKDDELKNLLSKICNFMNVSKKDLYFKNRNPTIVKTRYLFCKAARDIKIKSRHK